MKHRGFLSGPLIHSPIPQLLSCRYPKGRVCLATTAVEGLLALQDIDYKLGKRVMLVLLTILRRRLRYHRGYEADLDGEGGMLAAFHTTRYSCTLPHRPLVKRLRLALLRPFYGPSMVLPLLLRPLLLPLSYLCAVGPVG